MTPPRAAHVHAATLRLGEETDPAAVGAAVTVELCGHWRHDGVCRWPHSNEISTETRTATFRTVFVAPSSEVAEVHERIELALRYSRDWLVLSSGPRPVTPEEEALAAKLARTPVPGTFSG